MVGSLDFFCCYHVEDPVIIESIVIEDGEHKLIFVWIKDDGSDSVRLVAMMITLEDGHRMAVVIEQKKVDYYAGQEQNREHKCTKNKFGHHSLITDFLHL
jgi:hypothetical protein